MEATKYEEMIFDLTELIKSKNSELWLKDFRYRKLEEQLEAAEAKIKELEGNTEPAPEPAEPAELEAQAQ